MSFKALFHTPARSTSVALSGLLLAASLFAMGSDLSAQAADPRVGLAGGHWVPADEAIRNLERVSFTSRPARFFNPGNSNDFGFANTDLAFSGNRVFMGNYSGIQIWDISDPTKPTLASGIVCPGGQADVSVYNNLLFVSVEETRGRLDCGTQGVRDTVSNERFRGVRIFDISNLAEPKQVATVQTCRGSHTHTLVPDPRDPGIMYVYVQGTSSVRPETELPGCSRRPSTEDPNTSYFRIEVIRVPLAAPQEARIVSTPRIFANPVTGAIAGLWPGGRHGEGTQQTNQTNQCHDITSYPEIGLAAGACSGNGIVLDIRDPANPKRTHEVIDPNFAYWHSATFSNDGSKVIFTDEWGGGGAPRCQASDRKEWGANALFNLIGGKLSLAGYYKLPAPQTAQENCVAHNGSIIPVPGRDIMVQAWYQGGISVFDFTDPARPFEIAFFDRGPLDRSQLTLAGHWSAYWYNGMIVGSEIGRGLDIFALKPSEFLSQSEIDAAKSVRVDRFNPQLQTRIVWPASFAVVRSYLDQLGRSNGLASARAAAVAADLSRAEGMSGSGRRSTLNRIASGLDRDARGSSDAARVRAMAAAVRQLARG
ncbi:MAG: LVIVD repeat-containing protein [Gemmatimonadaceae bacterium]